MARYWSRPAFTKQADAEALLHRIHTSFADRSGFQWGLVLQTDDVVIGTCTLFHIDPFNGRAELGYALLRERWHVNGEIQDALFYGLLAKEWRGVTSLGGSPRT